MLSGRVTCDSRSRAFCLFQSFTESSSKISVTLESPKTDFERRLSRRELDRIRGIYASDSWDYQAAEAAFHDYTVYYEHDYAGWFFRALPLIRLGRLEEAIASLGFDEPLGLAGVVREAGDAGT